MEKIGVLVIESEMRNEFNNRCFPLWSSWVLAGEQLWQNALGGSWVYVFLIPRFPLVKANAPPES